MSVIGGRATCDGTQSYAARMAGRVAPGHMRSLRELSASSIGIGTYRGAADDATDAAYQAAVVRALEVGLNVIDTASNYRHQRSERAIGRALRQATESGAIRREEVIVASKAGFLAFDGERPADPRAYVQETLVDPGLLAWEDVVAGCHSLAPRYLRSQIEASRRNLGLETIDVYYLHNPETQLDEVPRPKLMARMREAFEALEAACADGAIASYGTATWTGYRLPPHHPGHLSMAELVALARDVGGAEHHFHVVQLPYNVGMPEARLIATQTVGEERMPALAAAARLALYVMGSASIEQGKLAQMSAQRALQVARSAAGMGTALVGMKDLAHVDENAEVATIPPAIEV